MNDFRYTPATVKTIRRYALTMSPAAIAVIMCCPIDMIEMICRKHDIRAHAKDIGRAPDPEAPEQAKAVRKELEIQIDETLLRVVKRQARQRDLDTHSLIERLIEKIAEDGLFSAVLDR